MTNNEPVSRVRLPGGPEQTISSVFVDEQTALVFEFFGNDIAIMIVVAPEWRRALAIALGLPEDARDASVLAACAERFHSYFDVQPWLERNGIPFEKEFESQA